MKKLKDILSDNGFMFKRQLGQNFISDTNLLNSIVTDSGIDKDTIVVEIGSGAGTLTSAIASVARKVITYEIDDRLIPVLNEYLEDFDNVEIINKDILKVTSEELASITNGKFKVVANLPYYITSPIIMRFIESNLDVDTITVMVQKEVAERLVAEHSTSEYGAITVAVKIIADVSITRLVTRKLFFPPPNVDSAVIRIDVNRSKYDIEDMILLKKVIKAAFAMRRKTLTNNLLSAFPISREQIMIIYDKLELKSNIRGEALSVSQFVELARMMGGIYDSVK